MKPPKWAYIIGILMLLFGGCGIIQDYQNIQAPKYLEMGEGIFDEIEKELEEELEEERQEREERAAEESVEAEEIGESEDKGRDSTSISSESDSEKEVIVKRDGDREDLEMVKGILKVSDYYKKWIVRFGYIGIFISVLYILAGLFLMIPKNFSIPMAYGVLGLSILVGIVQYIIFSRDESSGMVTMFSGLGVIFSIIIDFILLAVIFVSDKDVYLLPEEELN